MVALIPEDHGAGHFFRLSSLALKLKTRKIPFGFYGSEALKSLFPKGSVLSDDELKKVDWGIVDSNDISFVQRLTKKVSIKKTIWITDLQRTPKRAARTIIAPFTHDKAKNIFSGFEYFIVPNPGKSFRARSVRVVRNIGVAFGSLDETNNLFYFLYQIDQLDLWRDFRFNILIGRAYPYRRFIEEFFEGRKIKTLNFFESSFKSIYDFLRLNDVVVTCCNNTAFEALFCGVPVINIVQNHVQYENARRLQDAYGMPNLGFYPDTKAISKLFKGSFFNTIVKSSLKAKKIIDGKATERIVNIMKEGVKYG